MAVAGEGGLNLAAGPGGTLGAQAGDLGAASWLRRRTAALPAANIARSGSGRNCRATSAPTMRSAVLRQRAAREPRSTLSARRWSPAALRRPAAGDGRGRASATCIPTAPRQRISYGVLNLGHRNRPRRSRRSWSRAKSWRSRSASTMSPTASAAGNRLRLALSSLYWPLVWPSPRAGHADAPRPSSTLPARSGRRRGRLCRPGGRPPLANRDACARAHHRRAIERDETNGTVRLDILDDFGEVRDLEHGLVSGSIARESWTIHPDDPLSAAARRTGRKPCREANGRCAQRPSAGCGATPELPP